MEFKGTKAPWHYGKHGHVVNEFGVTVCQTYSKQEEDYENADINRKLISAAPDLLEALQNIVEQVEGCELDFNQIEAVKLAKAAINKALK